MYVINNTSDIHHKMTNRFRDDSNDYEYTGCGSTYATYNYDTLTQDQKSYAEKHYGKDGLKLIDLFY